MESIERQIQRATAIVLLLTETKSLPEEALRRKMRCVQKLPRHPTRDPDIIKRDLGTAYVEHRRHNAGQDITEILAVRTFEGQMLLKQIRYVRFRR